MKINVAIIDNKTEDKFILESILKQLEQDRYVFNIDCYADFQMKDISKEYDLYFIDMHFKQQCPLKLAASIQRQQNHAKIIFTSYREQEVFKAMQTEVFYFLRKQYLKQDLHCAINKYAKYYQDLHHIYVYKNNGRKYRFSYQEIMYFEVYKNSLCVTLSNNYKLEQRKTMKCLMEEIKDECFYQIHESYYINLSHVDAIENHQVVLLNKEVLPISKRKYKQTKEALQYYQIHHH
ncbi:MAG: LytTR family DNA-binding domain-containing protein [Erysipelotrichaceae bacterium]